MKPSSSWRAAAVRCGGSGSLVIASQYWAAYCSRHWVSSRTRGCSSSGGTLPSATRCCVACCAMLAKSACACSAVMLACSLVQLVASVFATLSAATVSRGVSSAQRTRLGVCCCGAVPGSGQSGYSVSQWERPGSSISCSTERQRGSPSRLCCAAMPRSMARQSAGG